MENTPTLLTNRLILRQFVREDLPALFSILSDPEVNIFLPWFTHQSMEETLAFLQTNFLETYSLPLGYRYAICLKEDHIPIGYINISPNESHDLGYGIHRNFWHQGIATEAGKCLLDHIQKVKTIPFITATHDKKNPNSGKVMQKLGMHYCYSYQEQWQPKNIPVIFRMYQLNFDGNENRVYQMNLDGNVHKIYSQYWDQYPIHFVETNL